MSLSLSLAQARRALREKELTATELVTTYIENASAKRSLNVYVTETFDRALEQARISDERLQRGTAGELEGLPLGIKDNFCTKGIKTTASSQILGNFLPPYESTVTQKLWNAGAVLMGKLNMDEFAMGSSTATSAFGPTINPWRSMENPTFDLTPGGSSGGSSAVVAAGAALAALGTDTGGSIRQPASFCGLVGLKPTYGRCSRWGIIALASSLDQAGPLTRSVEDAALLLQVIAGHDAQDGTSSRRTVPSYLDALHQGVRGLKIGIPDEYTTDQMDPHIMEMWDQTRRVLEEAGAKTVSISLPHTRYALPTYYVIMPAEASSNLARYDGVRFGQRSSGDNVDEMYADTREDGFGAEVKRRILVGTYILSHEYYDAYYLKAQKVRACIRQDFQSAFEKVDVILTPTTPFAPFPLDNIAHQDPLALYWNDVFTVPANLAGLPALSLPVMSNHAGLPLSMQLTGRHFDEETLLKVGSVIEKALGGLALPLGQEAA